MKPQTIEELKALLINAGYEKELSDILFIEDLSLEELEAIEFEDFEIEPIEFDELY